ncbi:MAG: InlB B-repeat-containing protein, partial [Candidatus Thorarchaeota archaeon]
GDSYTSIAIDSLGDPHIGYSMKSGGQIIHAVNATGSWVYEQIGQSVDYGMGLGISIAIDPSDNVHAIYKTAFIEWFPVYYATNTGGSWDSTELLDDGFSLFPTSIAIDVSGNLHITYDDGHDGLDYATCSAASDCTQSANWIITTIDAAVTYNSIATDSAGNVHVSYYDEGNGDLKYATCSSTSDCTQSANWNIQTVASTGDVGGYTSIAVDASGNVHMLFTDFTFDNLVYATNSGVTPGTGNCDNTDWDCETVDSEGEVGEYTSIAIDSSGGVHGSYYDRTNGALKYVYLAKYRLDVNTAGTGSGTVTSSPSGIDCGTDCSEDYSYGTSVTLTPTADTGSTFAGWSGDPDCDDGVITIDSGITCTATFDLQTFTLTADKAGSGTGSVTSSPSGIDCGADCSEDYLYGTVVTLTATPDNGYSFIGWIGCDLPSGNICDMTMDSNKTVTVEFSSWTNETVDSSGQVGMYTSIAIDSSDKAHISYRNSYNGDLKYATNASGSWVAETLDSTGIVGDYTSIAIDSSDNVYISYYDVTNKDLKYATNASGSWTYETVDSTGSVGTHTSMAIDSLDNVHISYYDASPNGDLKYATNASGSWVYETLDSSGYVGTYTSIAIDSTDNVHISYYDGTNGDLKYATNASGSWAYETLDSSGYVGSFTSIAVDSTDNVHISYYDYTNGDLRYDCTQVFNWSIQTVASTGDEGGYTSTLTGTVRQWTVMEK